MVEHLTTESFNEKVRTANETVLVDFFATWCGPCKMIAPSVERLAAEYAGKLSVYKLDVDEEPEVAAEYKVMSIPTLIYYRNGEEVGRVRGAQSYEELKAWTEDYL